LLSASLSRALVPGGGPGVVAGEQFFDPARFLGDVNRQFADPDAEMEQFATIAYGILDKRTGEAAIALAGHPLPIILRSIGECEYLEPGGLPVGMFPEVAYDSQIVHLGPGDRLIFYSDGVTECQGPNGELFGDQRMTALLTAAFDASASRLISTLANRLREWRKRDDFEDDISVLVLERPQEPSRTRNSDASSGETQ
jgi:sigma-B regulation protein RsbU (phosphoserine phosphatase)